MTSDDIFQVQLNDEMPHEVDMLVEKYTPGHCTIAKVKDVTNKIKDLLWELHA